MSTQVVKSSLTKTAILTLLILNTFCLNMNAAKKSKRIVSEVMTAEKIDPYKIIKEEEQEDTSLTFKRGDVSATFGGSIRIEYYMYDNITYLNKKIPDTIGALKQTIDLMFNLIYGRKKYNHDAFEAFLNLRSKNKWGVIGAYRNTSLSEITINTQESASYQNVSLGEHDHKSSRAIPWFKDAWLRFSVNSIFDLETENLHFIKSGWFPFYMGRGIALGSAYATVYEELGLYSYYSDSSAPGINIHGDIVKDWLCYDLYYAKFEDNSASSSAMFNTDKFYFVGRKDNPWSGESKDDELVAAMLNWKVFDDKNAGRLDLEPYVYYNEASDQKVEFKKDTKTELGAYGIAAEYSNKNFAMGGEIAFNYGHEQLRHIDRNREIMKRDANGNLVSHYSHVTTAVGANDKAIITDVNKATVDTSTNYVNNTELAPGGIANASNRFRPAYKNDFEGWMGVIDAEYTIQDWNLKFGTEYAHASGDRNPHIEEVDKKYKGFIGLHELYPGNRVKSALLAGERETRIPESISSRGRLTGNTPRFSNIQFLGFSLTWEPEKYTENNLKINPNLLFFWRTHRSKKYDAINEQVLDQLASKFLGTEINLIASTEILTDLTLSGVFSIFFPGQFFKDVKGVVLPGDYYKKIGSPAGVNKLDYRLNDDTAAYIDIALRYQF